MSIDYPKFCQENLVEEFIRLGKIGRTGVEALIARDSFQYRIRCEKLTNLTSPQEDK